MSKCRRLSTSHRTRERGEWHFLRFRPAVPISRAVVLNWEIGELFDLNTDASFEVTDETAKLGSYIYIYGYCGSFQIH